MSFTREIYELVARYMGDKYGYEPTIAELSQEEWSSVVGAWWDAKVFYGLDNHYASLDDVKEPADGLRVYIIGDKVKRNYEYRGGSWVLRDDTPLSIYSE